MPATVEELVGTVGVPVEHAQRVLDDWHSDSDSARISALCRTMGPEASDPSWPVRDPQRRLLKLGLYSPLQLLAWECGKVSGQSVQAEFPFLFDLSGTMAATLLEFREVKDDATAPEWPPNGSLGRLEYRELVRSMFRLREMREEREPLSLEVYLPSVQPRGNPIALKRFAQVVGRGVGVAQGNNLGYQPRPAAQFARLFREHKGAPSSLLYSLRNEFANVPKDRLSVVLRRDGLLSLAASRNPLMNFYDGGWHIEDSEAGRRAVDLLLTTRFPDNPIPRDLAGLLVRLAHHMASHWHSGIVAVVEDDARGLTLHRESRESRELLKSLRDAASIPRGKTLNLCDVVIEEDYPGTIDDLTGSKGLGRVFLTLAIQDGAVLFRPDGTLHSAARFARDSPQNVSSGGAGARAAKAIARGGLAIKVSHDGGIKVFAGTSERSLVPADGLKIR